MGLLFHDFIVLLDYIVDSFYTDSERNAQNKRDKDHRLAGLPSSHFPPSFWACINMIALMNQSFKIMTQSYYDNLTKKFLECIFHACCPNKDCQCIGQLSIHAYYNRYYGNGSKQILLRVLRVRCESCNTTHAILPVEIITYQHIPMVDACRACYEKLVRECSFNSVSRRLDIQTKSLKRLVKQFTQEYASDHFSIFGSLEKLISLSALDLERFYLHFHRLYLVKRTRLNHLHHSLFVLSFQPITP